MNSITMRQKRSEGTKICKSFAISGYIEDCDNLIKEKVENICNSYGLIKRPTKEVIKLLIIECIPEREIINRIVCICDLLEKYGYGIDTLEDNIKLLTHTSADLMYTLTITQTYGLDEEILTRPTFYSRVTYKEIYSLIEELKSRELDVNLENIQRLYSEYSNNKKLNDLNEIHPLDRKALFVATYLYNKNLNEKKSGKNK